MFRCWHVLLLPLLTGFFSAIYYFTVQWMRLFPPSLRRNCCQVELWIYIIIKHLRIFWG